MKEKILLKYDTLDWSSVDTLDYQEYNKINTYLSLFKKSEPETARCKNDKTKAALLGHIMRRQGSLGKSRILG